MGDDFNVGDVVVCVDDSASRDHLDHESPSPTVSLGVGAYYRVDRIVWTFQGDGIVLRGEEPHTCACCDGESGWDPTRFRKERPADPDFIRQLRALTPKEDNHA